MRVDAQVTAEEALITDLRQEDFVLEEEGEPQPIVYFGRDSEPLSLLLLLDVSGSMRKYVEQVALVARESLRFLRAGDRVAVMVFSRNTLLKTEFTGDLAQVEKQIRGAAREDSLSSATAINDSLLEAAAFLANHKSEKGRKAILILTDNLGLNYRSPDRPVIEALYKSDTVLNAIVTGRGQKPHGVGQGHYTNPDFTPPDVFLLADETGGEAVRADRAGAAFSRMIERIRTRYSLQYRPADSAKAGFRRISVELTQLARQRYPQAKVRSRKGYYLER